MADSPANRARIVPIMAADHQGVPSTTETTATTTTTTTTSSTTAATNIASNVAPHVIPKLKTTTRRSTSTPKPTLPSSRTTRSQTKALGLDNINVNLETLEVRGLYVFDTKGDGNCLYYALSDQMYGDWDHATEIRDNLSAHMEANRDYFAGFAVANGGERRSKRAAPRRTRTPVMSPSPTPTEIEDAFKDMISRTATNYIWGGAEEIQACCQFYKRDIRVYSENYVQDFRAWDAPDGESRDFLHLAYINNVHYSSVRNVDGPHEGLPNVKAREPSSPVILDLESAQPWKISCIREGLGGQYDHDTIVEMLRRCRGDIDRAFANLLDEDSSSASASSFVSSAASATSSQSSTATRSSMLKQELSHPQLVNQKGWSMTSFKPRLVSSRSSSRHSTASKRSAEDSDGDGPVSAVRPRGREQKRRILPKVTVGINFGDQERPDLVSLRLRVNSNTVSEPRYPSPSSLGQSEEPQPELKQTEKKKTGPKSAETKQSTGRKLRPRKPRQSAGSEVDSSSTPSSASPRIKVEED